MSDYTKEDYEFMAKAAGYNFWTHAGKCMIGSEPMHKVDEGSYYDAWTPDTDDGDCFRLMVDAGIQVMPFDWAVSASFNGGLVESFGNFEDNDKHVATRKAICDCAVEIGKTL